MAFASEAVPFYRNFRSLNIANLPIVSKSEYRDNYHQFLSEAIPPTERRDLLAAVDGQLRLGSDTSRREVRCGNYLIERSSGTTGPCVWYPRDRNERISMAVDTNVLRRRLIPSFSTRHFIDINPYTVRPEYSAIHNDPEMVVAFYKARIADGFNYIYGNLTLVSHHATLLSSKSDFDFKCVEVSGENLSPESRNLIEQSFNCPVLNQYGTRETWALGYSTSSSNNFELTSSNIVEIIDEHDNQVDFVGKIGAIVVTSLRARTFPIIRFRTGDRGCWQMVDGKRVLHLESDRQSTLFRTRSGYLVSGQKYFQRIFDSILVEGRHTVLRPWKIRQQGLELTIFLDMVDFRCIDGLRDAFAASPDELGHLRVRFEMWNGWTPLEKRIVYVDQTFAK
jgi:phenylacetate-coenzyme A ligase PaaK-like adenylate-forming protein